MLTIMDMGNAHLTGSLVFVSIDFDEKELYKEPLLSPEQRFQDHHHHQNHRNLSQDNLLSS